jgi:hypothetical protein
MISTCAPILLSAAVFLTGCIGLQIGGGEKRPVHRPTVGQELIDLKAARDAGAITEAEFQSQRTRLLAQ